MGSSMTIVIYLVVLFGFLYFTIMRPQQNERKQKEALYAEMAVGDTVLTNSGFYGVIIDIEEDTVIVEFGSNRNCRIPMQKAAVAAIEKPEDAQASAEDKKEKKDDKGSGEKKDLKSMFSRKDS